MCLQANGAAGRQEEDDDWGEFGGFEEAQPVPPELNQQVHVAGLEASPSPWASFPIGKSHKLGLWQIL